MAFYFKFKQMIYENTENGPRHERKMMTNGKKL